VSVLLTTIFMALREIWRNRMRSALTMLGVVIGVAAVITLVSIGRGATQRVSDDIGKLGRNLLMVSPGAWVRGGSSTGAMPLRVQDADAISKQILGASQVAPAASMQTQVVFGNKNIRTQVHGSTNEFFEVRGYQLQRGRSFTLGELNSGLAVCVVGATVANKLFGPNDPLGASLRVGKVTCTVIGLLVAKGQAGLGQDQDDLVILPLELFQRRLSGKPEVNMIYVSAEEGRSTALVADRIRALMRQRRNRPPGSEDDFWVRDMAEITATVTAATSSMTLLLGAIAAVSLLVCGIGIMNIMLVSVTERTREIGIRLSIGAFPGEVMLQFLLEAVVLSTLGGVLGVVAGVLGTAYASEALSLPFIVAPDVIVMALVFSSLVGVLFGYLPARRAARLNPIDALRHE
jgi:putative ABC transport system permease protein